VCVYIYSVCFIISSYFFVLKLFSSYVNFITVNFMIMIDWTCGSYLGNKIANLILIGKSLGTVS